MTNIYDQHKAAFAKVSAYIILLNDQQVAVINFKFPRDGAGRLYAYVHWIGTQMVRGSAAGYGYDKQGASLENAAEKLTSSVKNDDIHMQAFVDALANIGGSEWRYKLDAAGFTVYQAV